MSFFPKYPETEELGRTKGVYVKHKGKLYFFDTDIDLTKYILITRAVKDISEFGAHLKPPLTEDSDWQDVLDWIYSIYSVQYRLTGYSRSSIISLEMPASISGVNITDASVIIQLPKLDGQNGGDLDVSTSTFNYRPSVAVTNTTAALI